MEYENLEGKKERVSGGGVCIYCGCDGNENRLSSEHTMPYSLGGSTELLEASCSRCGAETSYLDGYMANSVFGHFRVHLGLKSRSGHPEVLPVTVGLPEGQKVVDLRPEEHPYFLNMPIWDPPGLLLERVKITDGFSNQRTDVFWHVPDSIRKTLGLSDKVKGEIINNIRPANLSTFARGITKIAYCTAIIKYGLDGFRPLFTPQIILGQYPHIPYFVGPLPSPHGPPAPRGQRHVVEFGTLTYQRLKLMYANVRLFADSSAPQSGMPRYQVIYGIEGKRKIVPKRALPDSRRSILQ
ncbi:MAG: HNH endonuclease [Pseudomonadota bacterium]|jgi:hypothetical protein